MILMLLHGKGLPIHNSKSIKGIATNNKSSGIFLLNEFYERSDSD